MAVLLPCSLWTLVFSIIQLPKKVNETSKVDTKNGIDILSSNDLRENRGVERKSIIENDLTPKAKDNLPKVLLNLSSPSSNEILSKNSVNSQQTLTKLTSRDCVFLEGYFVKEENM